MIFIFYKNTPFYSNLRGQGEIMATKLMDNAKRNKADEFYTQLNDIELELKHYKEQLKDKVIFCNCDDPYESTFLNILL